MLSMPLLPLPPVRWLSPSSLIVVLPLPVTLMAASFRLLASMFRSSKVTSTLPLEVSMVTVFSFDVPVMMVLVSSTSFLFPCETVFFPSVPLAFTVMSPFSMYHVSAKAGAARAVSIATVRTSAAAR